MPSINSFTRHFAEHIGLAALIALVSLASTSAIAGQVSFAGYDATKTSRSFATYYSDKIISKKIKSALKQEMDTDSEAILVATRSGIVQLQGSTDSRENYDRAIELARSIQGVKK